MNNQETDELRSALAQLRFLKGNMRHVLAWPLLCIGTAVLAWVLTLSHLASEERRMHDAALLDAQALARSYAEQLSRSVEQIDQITLNLAYHWKRSGGAMRLEEQAGQGLFPDHPDLSIAIYDRNGRLLTSLLAAQRRVDIVDRHYFQAHRDGQVAGLHIESVQSSRMTGRPTVIFSRTLTDDAGRFNGLLYVAVPPAFLASFYDKAAHGANDVMAVVSKQGDFIAARTGSNLADPGTLARRPVVFPAAQGSRVVAGQEFIDQRPRIVAWDSLAHYPLVSVVALSEEDIHLPFMAQKRSYINMASGASLLLLVAAALGSVLSGRLVWRKHQAAAIADTYRLAIEGAREGFFMARALYGKQRNITDFVLENCNEQGARMLGYRRSDLLDVRFSQIYQGRQLAKVMSIFITAMEAGFREDEFRQVHNGRINWMHRRLVRSGDGVAITLRDISEAKAHEQALETLGNTDALTALNNRHWLTSYLPAALADARRQDARLAVLYLDLDDFKDVNNTMGHDAGDDVLRQAGQRIQSVLRPGDHVVRLGGDEFTVLLSRVDARDDAVRVAARILDVLEAPFQVRGGFAPKVRASVGISLYPDDGGSAEALLKHADTAMYAAKNEGKARYAFYTPELTEEIVRRVSNESALRRAIEDRQFLLYYQPRVNAANGELLSMEALVRWAHPERGMVPPLEFIPLAEQTGLIINIGRLVIEQACAQMAAWQARGLRVVPVSVNVSPAQFAQSSLKEVIAEAIARHRIRASLLEIEITESCMMQDSDRVAADIAAVKALGVRISVDDFGTGYSSLSQLQRLDLDVLKVDRAFTQALDGGKQGEAFFMTIVSMAHILDMQVVAEGVETLEQLKILQTLGCNEVQGYFISRPVPAVQAEAFMVQRYFQLQPENSLQPA
ncbi:EAL domain-containing protein [Noviherbaspirillum sp. 1P10PC]|uniref:bifunctional diguanylate cyclase/phosphodiesterase n=1 Tax=Noviherbaspirillum sp. 1P10PC TaxID=3132292 RepID=UPI0039A1373B